MLRILLAAAAVLMTSQIAAAQGLPFLGGFNPFDYFSRYEITGCARRPNPQKRCITLLYDNKTYSLGAAASGVGPIPLNTPIRVVGYGLTGGPGLICPGTIGMVVRHVQPEPGGKCN